MADRIASLHPYGPARSPLQPFQSEDSGRQRASNVHLLRRRAATRHGTGAGLPSLARNTPRSVLPSPPPLLPLLPVAARSDRFKSPRRRALSTALSVYLTHLVAFLAERGRAGFRPWLERALLERIIISALLLLLVGMPFE